jgi:hypothetical protein
MGDQIDASVPPQPLRASLFLAQEVETHQEVETERRKEDLAVKEGVKEVLA